MTLSLIKWPSGGSSGLTGANNGLSVLAGIAQLGNPESAGYVTGLSSTLQGNRILDTLTHYVALFNSANNAQTVKAFGSKIVLEDTGAAQKSTYATDGFVLRDDSNESVVSCDYLSLIISSTTANAMAAMNQNGFVVQDTSSNPTVLQVGKTGTTASIPFTILSNNLVRINILANGLIAIGTATPTARLHLPAGTTAASSAPMKWTSGPLMTTAEVGGIEFLTDKAFLTINTGAARKEFTLNDAALTSGRVPFATTNGRIKDDASFQFFAPVSGTGPQLFLTATITNALPNSTIVISETWNTTAVVKGLEMNINDTASNAASVFISCTASGSNNVFKAFKNGAITAGDPGSGVSKWKLGTVQTAASTLKTTQYIEVEIDGVLVKLATMN